MNKTDNTKLAAEQHSGKPVTDINTTQSDMAILQESSLFDAAYYLSADDLKDTGLDPIQHYASNGWKERRWPRPDFDPEYYYDCHPEIAGICNPFVHFILNGDESQLPILNPEAENIKKSYAAIKLSGLFDEAYYSKAPDLEGTGIDPIEHYTKYGWKENRWPRADFDPDYYRKISDDVSDQENPFLHLIESGDIHLLPVVDPAVAQHKKDYDLLSKSDLFDQSFYREQINIFALDFDCVNHYLLYGANQGIRPRADFDPVYYIEHTETNISKSDAFLHYLREGIKSNAGTIDPREKAILFAIEKIKQSEWFDTDYYASAPDLIGSNIDFIEHYVRHGVVENRWPRPDFDPEYYQRTKMTERALGVSPFLHFIENGSLDSLPILNPKPTRIKADYELIANSNLFDTAYYKKQLNIVDEDYDCIGHFLRHGAAQGIRPFKSFDLAYYAEQWLKDTDIGEGDQAIEIAFQHYIRIGKEAGLATAPEHELDILAKTELIESSALFDSEHYLSHEDLVGTGIDPINHYVRYGWRENRWPRSDFNPIYYKSSRKIDSKENPFVHFIKNGSESDLPIVDPIELRIKEDKVLISESALFDFELYKQRLNITEENFDCIDHFLKWGAKQGLYPRKDFDPIYYSKNSMENGSPETAFQDFIRRENKDSVKTISEEDLTLINNMDCIASSGLFDDDFYSSAPDLASTGIDPIDHYVRYGWRENRWPRPDFDPIYYSKTNSECRGNTNPFVHFINNGNASELPYTDPENEKKQSDYRLIDESGMFDEEYYRNQVSIFDKDFDCIDHFINWGAAQNLKPRADFDPAYYSNALKNNSGNEVDYTQAFQHYIKSDKKASIRTIDQRALKQQLQIETIRASKLFDEEYYLSADDFIGIRLDPIEHYVKYGWRENRWPSAEFDPGYYRKVCSSIKTNEIPLLHFIESNEGMDLPVLDPNAELYANDYKLIRESGLFDENHYRSVIDIYDLGFDCIEHYLKWGANQGLQPRADFDPTYYANHCDDCGSKSTAFQHYIKLSDKDNVATIDPQTLADIACIELIETSRLFDTNFYLESEDLKDRVVDAVEHYAKYGYRENRWPRPDFDPIYYRRQHPELSKKDNPFAHFIENGSEKDLPYVDPKAEQRKKDYKTIIESGLFDEQYYRDIIRVEDPDFDCIDHYLIWGRDQGLLPRADFEPKFYQKQYDDYDRRLVDPFAHYIAIGSKENRLTKAPATQINISGDDPSQPSAFFEHPRPAKSETKVKTVAFYLPQFHPIPENDEWWGKGFTEWTNVTKARPLYKNHQQPRLPGDQGYYDLRLPEVLKSQAELASEFGINAFCFHYYWFGGKRLLEKPIDLFLENKDIDIEFCLNWANENWCRRWDGSENHILIEQKHSEYDDIALAADVEKYIRDERYLRVDGKPLFTIYRPKLIPDINNKIERWRDYFIKRGIGDVLFASAMTFDLDNPKELGFDFGVEFPPHNRKNLKKCSEDIELDEDFAGNLITYDSYVDDAVENTMDCDTHLFRGVMPSWDNTARRGKTSTMFYGSTPRKFQTVSESVVGKSAEEEDGFKNLMFVNAWNEWAESAVLESDKTFGHAYLNALNRAISGNKYNSVLLIGDKSLGKLKHITGIGEVRSLVFSGDSTLVEFLSNNLDVIKSSDLVIYMDTGSNDSEPLLESLVSDMIHQHYTNYNLGALLKSSNNASTEIGNNILKQSDKDILSLAGIHYDQDDLPLFSANDTDSLSFVSDTLHKNLGKYLHNVPAEERDMTKLNSLLPYFVSNSVQKYEKS